MNFAIICHNLAHISRHEAFSSECRTGTNHVTVVQA